jgi:hypothetical protein
MNSSLKLLVSAEEAIRRIRQQIDVGRGFRDQEMFSMNDLGNALERRAEWLENNTQMLKRLFNNPSFIEEYYVSPSIDMDSAITFSLKQKYFKDDMNEQIGRLESLLERVTFVPEITAEELMDQKLQEELMRHEPPKPIQVREVQPREAPTREMKIREELPKEGPPMERHAAERGQAERAPKRESHEKALREEPLEEEPGKEAPLRGEPLKEGSPPSMVSSQRSLQESKILIIHGRDEVTKESIINFLERLGLRALTLQGGRDGEGNLLEKFEESSRVDFAIVLFTPDDIAAPRNKPKERQARVSQNVLFEFGFFWGKLGNGRMCSLYQEGMEILADYPGFVNISMDSKGGWRLLVAKEIKQAGIEIDLNKAI